MKNKSLQALVSLAAALIALLFVKLMFDMSNSMREMTAHVGLMSNEVREMNESMSTMNDSMLRMERSINAMSRAFSQGSEQLQQWNPSGMMQQVLPGGGQGGR